MNLNCKFVSFTCPQVCDGLYETPDRKQLNPLLSGSLNIKRTIWRVGLSKQHPLFWQDFGTVLWRLTYLQLGFTLLLKKVGGSKIIPK